MEMTNRHHENLEFVKTKIDRCVSTFGYTFFSFKTAPSEFLPLGDKLIGKLKEYFLFETGKAPTDQNIELYLKRIADSDEMTNFVDEELPVRVGGDLVEIVYRLGKASFVIVRADSVEIREEVDTPFLHVSNLSNNAPPNLEYRDFNLLFDSFFPQVDEFTKVEILSFITACFIPGIDYPLLYLIGDSGSGKTTLSRLIKDIVDPSRTDVRTMPQNEKDMAIALQSDHLMNFDNISRVSTKHSDFLCKVSTGGSYSSRKLYSNDDEITLKFRRPVMLNGIDEFLFRDDLLSRSILIDLERIQGTRVKSSTAIQRVWEEHKAAVMGSIFNLVSYVLANLSRYENKPTSRLVDYDKISYCVATRLGVDVDSFIRNKEQKRLSVHYEMTYGGPLLIGLHLIVSRSNWEGTATRLLSDLESVLPRELSRKLPKSPARLSSAIRRLSRALPLHGIYHEKNAQAGTNLKIHTFKRIEENCTDNLDSNV